MKFILIAFIFFIFPWFGWGNSLMAPLYRLNIEEVKRLAPSQSAKNKGHALWHATALGVEPYKNCAKDKHKCENLETYKHRLKVMPEIVKFLIQHGANPDTLNNWGFTPIKNIISTYITPSNIEPVLNMVTLLLDNGADVNASDPRGAPALFTAVTGWNLNFSVQIRLRIIELFLKYDLDVNAEDQFGYTAIDYVEHEEVRELLRAHGAREMSLYQKFIKFIESITSIFSTN